VTHRQSAHAVSGPEVATHLQPVLVQLLALALNGKQAHWHVRGRQFVSVHEQLDTVVADARKYADDIAERVVTLGEPVDGRARAVAEATGPFPDGFLADDKAVSLIIEHLDAVIEQARAALHPLEKLDLVSQDLVIELVEIMEKHRWMFEAQADRH
jgi:starvation-inducible DNA-binding protein